MFLDSEQSHGLLEGRKAIVVLQVERKLPMNVVIW